MMSTLIIYGNRRGRQLGARLVKFTQTVANAEAIWNRFSYFEVAFVTEDMAIKYLTFASVGMDATIITPEATVISLTPTVKGQPLSLFKVAISPMLNGKQVS